MTSKTLVDMTHVRKSFGRKTVLRDINLKISSGEVVGIIGPNGGGKSTLLKLIAGLIKPTEGLIKVDGTIAHELALAAHGHVGLVLARPGLYPLLTGWENLYYFAGLFGISEEHTQRRAKQMLDDFEIKDEMHQQVQTWSTGMQQKLSLVRALVLSPKILLFDEPAANLDPLASKILFEALRKSADDGLACVLVTHDLHAVESLCDRVFFVDSMIKKELKIEKRKNNIDADNPLLEMWLQHVGGKK